MSMIETKCPYCGKVKTHISATYTAEQTAVWKQLMTDYAEALCSCDETLSSQEETVEEYRATQFRRRSRLYFVSNAYHLFTYEFTMPNRNKEYLTVLLKFDFMPTGETTLQSLPYIIRDVEHGPEEGYYPEWEEFSFFKEIDTSSLTRENLDKMAIECYRQFIEAGGKNERNN